MQINSSKVWGINRFTFGRFKRVLLCEFHRKFVGTCFPNRPFGTWYETDPEHHISSPILFF